MMHGVGQPKLSLDRGDLLLLCRMDLRIMDKASKIRHNSNEQFNLVTSIHALFEVVQRIPKVLEFQVVQSSHK